MLCKYTTIPDVSFADICSAVSTHSGRGSPKSNQYEHGVIYTGKSAPDTRNEPGMQPKAIKVNPDQKGAVLDENSRLNYGKVYNVEHNVKVKNFGSLNPESLKDLIDQFTAVFTSKIRQSTSSASAAKDHEPRPDMTGQGSKPGNQQQFLAPAHRSAVAQHTRNLNVATTDRRGAAANTQANSAAARGREQPTVESDDDDDDEEDDEESDSDATEEESGNENEAEDADGSNDDAGRGYDD